MSIKSFSHYLKFRSHLRGQAFAVLGYPRSGTTMLSELVAMVTSYYFDRNNMLPATGRMVLHSHWNPGRFVPQRSLYIVRDPVSVARSILTFYEVQGWKAPRGNPLADTRTCRMDWSTHVRRAQGAGLQIVDYNRLLARHPDTLAALAAHLSARPQWIESALALLSEMHRDAPHQTDVRFRTKDASRDDADRESLQASLKAEIELYQSIAGKNA